MAKAALTARADSATEILGFPRFPAARLRNNAIPRPIVWRQAIDRVTARAGAALARRDRLAGSGAQLVTRETVAYERALFGLAELPAPDLQGLCEKMAIFKNEIENLRLLDWKKLSNPLAYALQADARRVVENRPALESLIDNLITALDLADDDPDMECSDPTEDCDPAEMDDHGEDDDPGELDHRSGRKAALPGAREYLNEANRLLRRTQNWRHVAVDDRQ